MCIRDSLNVVLHKIKKQNLKRKKSNNLYKNIILTTLSPPTNEMARTTGSWQMKSTAENKSYFIKITLI